MDDKMIIQHLQEYIELLKGQKQMYSAQQRSVDIDPSFRDCIARICGELTQQFNSFSKGILDTVGSLRQKVDLLDVILRDQCSTSDITAIQPHQPQLPLPAAIQPQQVQRQNLNQVKAQQQSAYGVTQYNTEYTNQQQKQQQKPQQQQLPQQHYQQKATKINPNVSIPQNPQRINIVNPLPVNKEKKAKHNTQMVDFE